MIQEIYPFIRHPENISPTQLIALTTRAQKSSLILRESFLPQIIEATLKACESFEKKSLRFEEKEFRKFDGSFSSLLEHCFPTDKLLRTIFEIEKVTKNHFRRLQSFFVPIVLESAGKKQAIVSQFDLDPSKILRQTVSSTFVEASDHKIILKTLSEEGFKTLVTFLRGRSLYVPYKRFAEMVHIAHLYGISDLFVQTLSIIVPSLVIESAKGKPADPDLKEGFFLLYRLLGFETGSKNATLASIDPFLQQLMPEDDDKKEDFFQFLTSIGKLLERGIFDICEPTVAAKLYEVAALFDCPRAQYMLASLYEFGKGVPKDLQKAHTWYERAVDTGCPEAMCRLAHWYEEGIFFEKSSRTAATYYIQAACGGNAEALYIIGQFHEHGKYGCRGGIKRAFEWYTLAAKQFYPKAQLQLGVIYEQGSGVQKDLETAFKWYTEAALQENAEGELKVAEFYRFGIAVLQDSNEAKKWYERAVKHGSKEALQALAAFHGK